MPDGRTVNRWDFKEVPHEPPQDVEALGVDRPGELSLTLDVDGTGGARPDGGGDPGGEAVGERSRVYHAQPVELPDR